MKKRDLVRQKALSLVGSPYVWGGTGDRCTVANRQKRIKQYPQHADGITNYCPALKAGKTACVPGCKNLEKPILDCAQLVRIAYKAADIILPSGASSQWRRGGWERKGSISEMPKNEVCAVYRETATGNPMGHTGIYLGDGTVVDARGSRYGTLHKPLSSYRWTHYGIMPGMDEDIAASPQSNAVQPPPKLEPNPPPAPQTSDTEQKPPLMGVPTLRYGFRGEDVAKLQVLLNLHGAGIVVDGIFGKKTLAAVRNFQANRRLKVDGIVGVKTWGALKE